uniref:Uncharacterized protein n=1 Tax=Anguilla anguilla TaxID=7936 RepID=A0A0E9R7C7_ANGAN
MSVFVDDINMPVINEWEIRLATSKLTNKIVGQTCPSLKITEKCNILVCG